MAILVPSDVFSDVYKIETVDPVKGGTVSGSITAPTDGHANAPLQALANRTLYLYNRMLPVGATVMWFGATPPTGWLICAGAEVSRSAYSELYAVIGNSCGSGNGTTTFDLPDTRGRTVRGVDNGAGTDPDAGSRLAMNAGGNTGDSVGSIQEDEFESHTHSVPYSDGNTAIATNVIAEQSNSQETSSKATASSGGSETRMKNFGANFIIKYI